MANRSSYCVPGSTLHVSNVLVNAICLGILWSTCLIVSILEMEKLKYREVKELAQVVERQLEPRQLKTKDCSLNYHALLPLGSLERTWNTDSSKIGEKKLMGDIISVYRSGGERS